MQGMRQGSTGKVEQVGSPVFWQGGEASASASTLEVAVQEVNLLPEFEEFLRKSMPDAQHVPGREGLLG
jgi:hypothetical protein